MNIRKLLILFSLALISMASGAQELTIKSFEIKSNDLSASTSPRYDNNGEACALLKVHLAVEGAVFEGNIIGEVEFKTSEYWVYMPKGSKRLKIKLPHYLPLVVEFANCGITSLDSKSVYNLIISGVINQPAVSQQTGWLILKSTPGEADVYLTINGVEIMAGTTPFQQKLAYGDYRYRISKPLYYDEIGVATINQSKVNYNLNLSPAHGRLHITSRPSGAKVSIEGIRETYVTPCTTDVMASGEYTIRVSKEKHSAVQQKVMVKDGKVVETEFNLVSNLATVTINSIKDAEIFIDGAKVGTTQYVANLTPGIYDVEVRKENFKTVHQQIEVVDNQEQVIQLLPERILGNLDVVTDPMEVVVIIDGKNYGETPVTIGDLPVGTYTVQLSKLGYCPESITITVEEGKTSTLNCSLKKSDELSIDANKNSLSSLSSRNTDSITLSELGNEESRRAPVFFFLVNGSLDGSGLLPSLGLTIGGGKKTVGWFASAVKSDMKITPMYLPVYIKSENLSSSSSKYCHHFSVVTGPVFNFSKWFALRIGLGYGQYSKYIYDDQKDLYHRRMFCEGLDLTIGGNINLGRLTISAEAVSTNFWISEIRIGGAKFGLGVNF